MHTYLLRTATPIEKHHPAVAKCHKAGIDPPVRRKPCARAGAHREGNFSAFESSDGYVVEQRECIVTWAMGAVDEHIEDTARSSLKPGERTTFLRGHIPWAFKGCCRLEMEERLQLVCG